MLNFLSFETFNQIEGTFWILLGLAALISWIYLDNNYKKITLVSSIILILFGISDFMEVKFGSFLDPNLLWLLSWKVAGVTGLLLIGIWFFKLSGNKQSEQ